MLVRAFLARHGRADLEVTFRFMTALLHYDWPYNVRELEACIKRALALCDGLRLDAVLLPDPIREAMIDYGKPAGAVETVTDSASVPRRGPPTEEELRNLLAQHDGNVAAVGRVLGKARMQIHRWLQKYDIDLGDYRPPP